MLNELGKWRALAIAVVMTAGAMQAASHAQTNPPPPSRNSGAVTRPVEREAAPVESSPPAVSPVPKGPSRGVDLQNDIDDQSAIAAGDREMEAVRKQVFQARQHAQQFRHARARLSEIIAGGKCGGVGDVLKSLARQEAESRKLVDSMNEMCKGVPSAADTAVARNCSDERRKLDAELKAYDDDRERVRKICPQEAS